MPAVYTHYRFASDVLTQLPDALRARIEPHRSVFDLGLHGPDVFLYHNPLLKGSVNRLGTSLHEQTGTDVFRRFFALYDSSDAAFAYLSGFLCHFALDSTCCPYLEQMELLGVSHDLLETQLDRCFLLLDAKDPICTDLTAHIDPSNQNTKVAAAFFPQVSQSQLEQALKQMIFYHRLIQPKSRAKRQLLTAAVTAARVRDGLGARIMQDHDIPACKQMITRLRALYGEAIPLATELICQFPLLKHPRYRQDFHGQLAHLKGEYQ